MHKPQKNADRKQHRPNGEAVNHEAETTKMPTPKLWLPVLVFLAALASSSQIPSPPAEIKFRARGNSRGEKIVRELLDRETESARKGLGSQISRTNYDFVFLGRRTSASFLSTSCESSRSGRTNTF